MQFPKVTFDHGYSHQQSDHQLSFEEAAINDYSQPHKCKSHNTYMGRLINQVISRIYPCSGLTSGLTCLNLGTFEKVPWRPQQGLYTSFGPPPVTQTEITLHENPYTAPDLDLDGNGWTRSSASEQSSSIYEQPSDTRIDPLPQ